MVPLDSGIGACKALVVDGNAGSRSALVNMLKDFGLASVAQARNDVAHFIEMAVDCRCPAAHVGMSLVQRGNPFGRGHQNERTYIFAAAPFEQIDRPPQRAPTRGRA